jgi:hypothetical protein
MKPQAQAITPDVVIIIEHDSRTGATLVKTGNNQPIQPLVAAVLGVALAKANLDALIQQQSLIIKPAVDTPNEPPNNNEPPVVQ